MQGTVQQYEVEIYVMDLERQKWRVTSLSLKLRNAIPFGRGTIENVSGKIEIVSGKIENVSGKIENVRHHMLQKFRNGSNTARFTMDDTQNGAIGVFRKMFLHGLRCSFKRETMRFTHIMGNMQVPWIKKTTIDVSKWTPLN